MPLFRVFWAVLLGVLLLLAWRFVQAFPYNQGLQVPILCNDSQLGQIPALFFWF